MEQLTVIPTLEQIKERASISGIANAIEWTKEFYYDKHPIRPKNPKLSPNYNSSDVKKYAQELEEWENKMEKYNEEESIYRKHKGLISSLIIEFIKDEAGLFTVPEKYQQKVWRKAWGDGHSDGFYEVYLKLQSLIEIFEA